MIPLLCFCSFICRIAFWVCSEPFGKSLLVKSNICSVQSDKQEAICVRHRSFHKQSWGYAQNSPGAGCSGSPYRRHRQKRFSCCRNLCWAPRPWCCWKNLRVLFFLWPWCVFLSSRQSKVKALLLSMCENYSQILQTPGSEAPGL